VLGNEDDRNTKTLGITVTARAVVKKLCCGINRDLL
jgi:hypothetical protein